MGDMTVLYSSMFRSIYRRLRALNGPAESHEYIAALCLSLCSLLNTGTLILGYQRWSGANPIGTWGRSAATVVYFALFVMHYLVLIRGKREE